MTRNERTEINRALNEMKGLRQYTTTKRKDTTVRVTILSPDGIPAVTQALLGMMKQCFRQLESVYQVANEIDPSGALSTFLVQAEKGCRQEVEEQVNQGN